MECVRCAKEIEQGDLIYCGKCESPHHQHCWDSHQKQCGMHGCAQTSLIVKQVYELASKGDYNVARHMLTENMYLMTTVDPYDVMEDLRESEINYHKLNATRVERGVQGEIICQVLVMTAFIVFVAFILYNRVF